MVQSAESSRLFEVFEGMPIHLDARVETPARFDNTNTLPVPKAGETITFQIFVPQSAGKKTYGYDITFGLAGKNIEDYVLRPTGETWDGTTLNQLFGYISPFSAAHLPQLRVLGYRRSSSNYASIGGRCAPCDVCLRR